MEVKICGITNLKDAICAIEAGADYIGFVFYEKSPRFILPDVAHHIAKDIRGKIKLVGVFVNKSKEDVIKIADHCYLDVAQLHGDEIPDEFKKMPVNLWRAIRLNSEDEKVISFSAKQWNADRYLLDSFVKDSYGGSGVPCNWQKAAQLAKKFPVMLSGGLNCENLQKAIAKVRPVGVDVSTGVEIEPGKKDEVKVKKFVELAKKL